jgi:signal transduction histidine kinase
MKFSYILFALMLIGLGTSLYLYNDSKNNSIQFNERSNVVQEVRFLLERTDKLKMVLRKTVFDGANVKDTAFVFSRADKSQVDSILDRLHKIVLYQDQRLRIDSIKHLVASNYLVIENKILNVQDYRPITPIIIRAQAFAEASLKKQQREHKAQEEKASLWLRLVLGTSIGLLIIGVWVTIDENSEKRKLERLYHSILSNTTVGISVLKLKEERVYATTPTVSYANFGAVVKKDGNEPDRVVNLSSLFREQEMISALHIVATSGKSIIKEIEHTEADGTKLWFLTNLSWVGPATVAFYYQDITRLKLYGTHLRAKVAELENVNKELEQFAHATSHDLKEPFRKIQVMADLLIRNHFENNRAKYLDGIARASDKGSKLVDQILNYSKVQFDKSQQEFVDLNLVISQVIEDLDLIILEKDALIRIGELPKIFANKVQIQQMFYNLISNSLKFSAGDRRPEVAVIAGDASANDVEASDISTFVKITVKDNGIGFDNEYAVKIFNAFERLNNYVDYPGSGLGLSLCKKIVINHGGKITAVSVPGKGSEFNICFPKPTPTR